MSEQSNIESLITSYLRTDVYFRPLVYRVLLVKRRHQLHGSCPATIYNSISYIREIQFNTFSPIWWATREKADQQIGIIFNFKCHCLAHFNDSSALGQTMHQLLSHVEQNRTNCTDLIAHLPRNDLFISFWYLKL